MNKAILGFFAALVLLGVGMFWWQGRAEVERGAPPPDPAALARAPATDLPTADPGTMRGAAPPEATELTREQRRFFRYDRNRDLKITRNEMLSTRADAFRKLDTDHNNLLSFEEWAVVTAQRFDGADANHDQVLTQAEFASTASKPGKAKPKCSC